MPTSQPRPGVVVTGAAGFIGRHVVAALQAAGHAVTGVDRRPWQPHGDEHAVVADLLEPTVTPLLGRADAVVHLAGCPGVRDDRPDAGRWRWRDNVLAGEAVLRAVPANVPLLVTSSSSVYGGAGTPSDPRPCHEDDPRRPRGGYARSKAAFEDLCARRLHDGGHVAVLRPFTVAGEGQRGDMALSRWIEAVRIGAPVTILGSPHRRRDVTDVRDVARVVLRALERRLDGTCNVGTGTAHTLADLLAAVERSVGRQAEVRVRPAASEEVPATLADTTRCRTRLGFVPATNLQAVVDRQVAAATAGLLATA